MPDSVNQTTPELPHDAPLKEGHTYDGIQEYDNPLPGWWKGLFWATTLFAIPYTVWYHFMGNSIPERYEAKMAEIAAAEAAEEKLPDDAASLVAMMDDPEVVAAGKAVWQRNCFACHAQDGGGMTGLGPNMTDDHYKNIEGIEGILTVLREGVPGTSMVAGGGLPLTHNEIVQVSVFVASLRGTTPADPKEPEGEVLPPWGT